MLIEEIMGMAVDWRGTCFHKMESGFWRIGGCLIIKFTNIKVSKRVQILEFHTTYASISGLRNSFK